MRDGMSGREKSPGGKDRNVNIPITPGRPIRRNNVIARSDSVPLISLQVVLDSIAKAPRHCLFYEKGSIGLPSNGCKGT